MFQESAEVMGKNLYILRVEEIVTSEYEWAALCCLLRFCFRDYATMQSVYRKATQAWAMGLKAISCFWIMLITQK